MKLNLLTEMVNLQVLQVLTSFVQVHPHKHYMVS